MMKSRLLRQWDGEYIIVYTVAIVILSADKLVYGQQWKSYTMNTLYFEVLDKLYCNLYYVICIFRDPQTQLQPTVDNFGYTVKITIIVICILRDP